MNDLVSIVIPIYNSEKYLNECIESVVNQTYSNLEIILVNDGSTDDSDKICETWKNKDNRIMVISKDNSGVSDARNCGIQKAIGKYVAFVDSDDVIHSQYIDLLCKAILINNSDIAICSFSAFTDVIDTRYKAESHIVTSQNMSNEECAKTLLEDSILETVFVHCKMFKRQILGDLKFKAGKLCEDNIFMTEIIAKGAAAVKIPNKLYFYRIVENSISHSRSDQYFIDYCYAFVYQWDILKDKYDRDFRNTLMIKVTNTLTNFYCTIPKEKKEIRDYVYNATIDFVDKNKRGNKVGIVNELKILFFKNFPNLYCLLKKL